MHKDTEERYEIVWYNLHLAAPPLLLKLVHTRSDELAARGPPEAPSPIRLLR